MSELARVGYLAALRVSQLVTGLSLLVEKLVRLRLLRRNETVDLVERDGIGRTGWQMNRRMPIFGEFRSRLIWAMAMYAIAGVVGALLFPRLNAEAIASPEQVSQTSYSAAHFALRNGAIVLMLLLGGCFLGVVTLGVLIYNGYLIGGIVGAALATETSPWYILAYLGPHGVIELSGFFLAGAIGFDIALYFVDRLRNYRTITLDGAPTKLWIRGAAASVGLIVLAAVIEAHLTPVIVGMVL